MKKYILIAVLFLATVSNVYAHCQIPCGIYDDKLRFSALEEDVKTIEKSINEINTISKADTVNYNQLVRWVNNKEEYSNKIIDVMSNYFLAQRIKPEMEGYDAMLKTVHKVIILAMKNKQNADVKFSSDLLDNIMVLKQSYEKAMEKHDH